jgi:hypothetical protein
MLDVYLSLTKFHEIWIMSLLLACARAQRQSLKPLLLRVCWVGGVTVNGFGQADEVVVGVVHGQADVGHQEPLMPDDLIPESCELLQASPPKGQGSSVWCG